MSRARAAGLRLKLVLSFGALVVTIAAFIFIYFPSRLEREASAAVRDRATELAELVALSVGAALYFDDADAVADIVRGASARPDISYLIVTDKHGAVVITHGGTADGDRRPPHEDPTATAAVFAAASAATYADVSVGMVYVGLSRAQLRRAVASARRDVAVVSLFILLVGCFAIVVIATVAIRPLTRIVAIAERTAAGDLSGRAPVRSRDEIGRLAGSFNAMLDRLDAAYDELRVANRDLESRVEERTRALRAEAEERVRTEQALRSSEQRFRAVYECTSVAIVLFGVDGCVIEANDAFAVLTGEPRESARGVHVTDWIDPEHVDGASRTFRAALAHRHARVHGELRCRRRNGDIRICDTSLFAVRDDDDNVRFLVGMLHDISDRKELEERSRQGQRLESVGRLAGGIAHDFNNLLTTINGLSELLLTDGDLARPLRQDVQEIRDAGERAATLTRQLLAFSRRQVLRPKNLDLNGVVLEMNRMLGRLIGEDVVLESRLDARRPICADPGQLSQVLMNLAVNARDAMPTGGTLTITTREVVLSNAEAERFELGAGGEFVALTVADTGHGMDSRTVRRMFEPFFTTKEPGKGTGLGLATVHGIVRQSGGGIRVQSAPGEGTAFTIVLPVATGAVTVERPEPAVQPANGHGTVLVVEDELHVRTLVARILERAGYDVLTADSATAALALVASHDAPIHALLTDVVMPGMMGPELARRVRAVMPGIRVLFMSGYTEREVIQHGIALDSATFIQKPMSPRALASLMGEILATEARSAA